MDNRFADMIRQAQQDFASRGGMNGGLKRPRVKRQWTRQIVRAGQLDRIEWLGNLDEENSLFTMTPVVGARHDAEVDAAIDDLFYGNRKDPTERAPYLNGPELLQDLFMTFIKPDPQLYRKAEVVKDARLNGKFIEQMMALPVYEDIHDYTMNDPEASKDALLALVDIIKEMIRQHREAVEEANRRREEDGCDPNGPPGNNDKETWDDETPGNTKSKSGKGKSRFQRHDPSERGDEPDWKLDYEDGTEDVADSDDTDDQDDEDGDSLLDDQERDTDQDEDYDDESDWEQMVEQLDIGRFANAALEKSATQMGDLKDARAGIGLDESEWKLMDPKERLKIAKQLTTPRMKAIADMVGRMKRFALSKQAQKIIDAPHEIYTVHQGNDLARTVRSEFGLLGAPETKAWFYYKFVEASLLQYQKRGHEDVGKGPLIVLIDNSGSMSGPPENWAKGVAEALRRIAADQGRDYHAIYFETNSHRERFFFPEGKGPFDKIMAFLSVSAGGGTQFDGVLAEALQKAQTSFEFRPDQGKSDLVLITDGWANLDQKWIDDFNEKRNVAGVRVFSVLISASDYGQSQCMDLLNKFSDVAVPVKALAVNDDSTDQLFTKM